MTQRQAETLAKRAPRSYQDSTNYAKHYGYRGRKVIVSDGKVITHGNKDWFEFMEWVRAKWRFTWTQ